MRYLLQPGDCALVDDPGYYNLFGNLRMHGVEMLAVPRRPDGRDFAALEALAAARPPKVYFTQSAMQNPTGSNTSPHVAFRLLQAAESHGFTIVEDDIFCDLQRRSRPTRDARPARSRHLCEELLEDPVGKSARRIVASTQSVVDALADIKMLTSSRHRNSPNACSTSCLSTGITENTCRGCGSIWGRHV